MHNRVYLGIAPIFESFNRGLPGDRQVYLLVSLRLREVRSRTEQEPENQTDGGDHR